MLHHTTYEGLQAQCLEDVAEAYAELETGSAGHGLSSAEWLWLLLDRVRSRRGKKRYCRRFLASNLRHGDARREALSEVSFESFWAGGGPLRDAACFWWAVRRGEEVVGLNSLRGRLPPWYDGDVPSASTASGRGCAVARRRLLGGCQPKAIDNA